MAQATVFSWLYQFIVIVFSVKGVAVVFGWLRESIISHLQKLSSSVYRYRIAVNRCSAQKRMMKIKATTTTTKTCRDDRKKIVALFVDIPSSHLERRAWQMKWCRRNGEKKETRFSGIFDDCILWSRSVAIKHQPIFHIEKISKPLTRAIW